MKMKMIPLLVCAAAALVLPSFATTYTWNASVTSGNWDDAANWLVNGSTATSYPSSSSDVAIFAANTTASVALTTARTVSKLDLSAANVSLTLTQGATSLSTSKLTVSTLSLDGENLAFTLAGVSLKANNKPKMGNAARLYVKDGAYFDTGVFHNQPATTGDSGTTAMGDSEQGGQIYVSGGSTAKFTGLHMKNGLLEIDDATVNHEWGVIFWAETGSNQTTIRFKGKNPILKCIKSDLNDYAATYGTENGFNAHFEFVVPEGGYAAAPLQNEYGWNKFLTGKNGTNKDGTFAIDVSADSPANFAGEPLTAQLIKCTNSKGIETSNVKSVNLPNEADSYAWGTDSKTLDVTLTGTDIAVSPTTEGATWKGIALTFATSVNTRELYVAYGATDGGSDAASWTTTAKLGDLAAGATSYNYLFSQTTDATWGSDSFKVVRFYILVDGTKHWSPATVWSSLATPIFSATPTADGAGGDAITVTGGMSAYPGDTCTFKVLTGKSADALTDEWTDESWVLQSSDGSNAFSLTLRETDAATARLAPGNDYYVAVVAESAATVATSAVATVTTASGAAKFETKAASVDRRTVTFSGKLSAVGFNGKSEVTLWVGESESESALSQVGTAITVTSAGTTFKWDPIKFDVFGKTYYYQLRTTSTSAGGTATTSAKTTIGSFTTTDGAVPYQWTGAVSDGDWTNPGNWDAGDYKDDCLGYPASVTSSAKFPAGTTVEFSLSKDTTIGTLDLSAGGASVTFKKTEGATYAPLLKVMTALNLNGANNAFTIDGMRLSVEKAGVTVTLGSGSTWSAVNGATVWLGSENSYFYNKGGKVCVEGGSSFSCQRHYLQDSAYLLVSNATFTASHRTVWNSTDAANPDVIRLEGANALYKMTYPDYHFFCAGTANAVLNLDFVVPKTGFAAAPLQSVKELNVATKTAATYAIGSGNTDVLKAGGVLNVNLIQSEGDMNSEAVTTPLISWPGAGISKTVVQEGSKSRKSMKFVWKDSSDAQTTADYPTALEAVIPGRSGFILTIR